MFMKLAQIITVEEKFVQIGLLNSGQVIYNQKYAISEQILRKVVL